MSLFLIVFAVLEICNFIAIAWYQQKPDDDGRVDYLNFMKLTMAISYGINILAFIPLYVVVMVLLRLQFALLFQEIQVKSLVIFLAFLTIVIFRYIYYLCLSFVKVHIEWMDIKQVHSEIPFYISEVAISICFMYFLVRLYTKHNGQTASKQEKSEELPQEHAP